jgi:predicted nucleic acid-binding protein
MSEIVLTDSCFWLGLLDSRDQHHPKSIEIFQRIYYFNKILFPWPCLYETISTRLIRNNQQTIYFENKILKKKNIEFLDDTKYKTQALNNVFYYKKMQGSTFSLVDAVIREIIKDKNIKINYFVTFNSKDFHDVCAKRRIEIVKE